MKKIYSILITLIILISMSMGNLSSATTIDNTQKIKMSFQKKTSLLLTESYKIQQYQRRGNAAAEQRGQYHYKPHMLFRSFFWLQSSHIGVRRLSCLAQKLCAAHTCGLHIILADDEYRLLEHTRVR